LYKAPDAYNTHINDLLLTALAQVLVPWFHNEEIWINLEGHGREPLFSDVDLSRTVGWFTSSFPIRLKLTDEMNPEAAIKSIKEQLRQVPDRGISYGVLRYLADERVLPSADNPFPEPQVGFNYLGQLDSVLADTELFRPAPESIGFSRSPQAKRPFLILINSFVADGYLQVQWQYSQQCYQQGTIRMLAQCYLEKLQALIQHCLSPVAGGYTPSDFPDIDLDQDQLDGLLSSINLE
jgi:non-ribosomal peptide synthase protein (TIGR01720 family)